MKGLDTATIINMYLQAAHIYHHLDFMLPHPEHEQTQ